MAPLTRESVDVYLAELCKLAVLFRGISDHDLACAFVKGLPNHVKPLLHASSWMEVLTIKQMLYVNKDIASATSVAKHLSHFELTSKIPE